MTTLGFERGTSATDRAPALPEGARPRSSTIARRNGKLRDPVIRQRLALAWSKVKIMQINGLRTLTSALNDDRAALPSGPRTRCSGPSTTAT